MPPETNWIPGIVVLAVALAAGAIVLFAMRRRNARTGERDGELDDLERRGQVLIAQLKELEADKHHLHPDQYISEKARLEALAAAAFRAKDEYLKGARPAAAAAAPSSSAAAASAPDRKGFFASHPELKGALWGGGVVLFFVVLGLLLSQEQKPRREDESITGRAPPNASVEQQVEHSFQNALAQARENPTRLDASARVVHELIRRQDWEEAARITERALGADPFHVEHRVHRALLKARERDPRDAIAELQKLALIYPGAHEALLFVGALAMQHGDERTALQSFEQFAAVAPQEDQLPQLQEAIADLRRRVAGAPTQKR